MPEALIPHLPSLCTAPAHLPFDAGVPIELGLAAGQETLFAAQQLQAAVHDATGMRLPLRKTAEPGRGEQRIALLLAGRDPLEAANPDAGAPRAQRFRLRVVSQRVRPKGMSWSYVEQNLDLGHI